MKLTSRAGLAVLMTCMASAAAVSPAAADAAPVPIPLEGLETAVPIETPKLHSGVPILKPGAPQMPRTREGRLVPEGALPQLPLSSSLPHTVVDAPLTDPVSKERLAGASLESLDSPVRAVGPGLGLDAPLARPGAGPMGLPQLNMPQAALLTPMLQTDPRALTQVS